MKSFKDKKKLDIDKVFDISNYIILGIVLVVTAYPLIYILSSSFSGYDALMKGKVVLWPVDFSIEGYRAIFSDNSVIVSFFNSVFIVVFGTMLNVFLTIICAYPLSRKDFYGRNVLMFIFSFTMYFNGGLIPTFMLVKNLGLYNTRLALILPGAIAVYNMIIAKTYFQHNIPDEFWESAKIEGCDDFTFIWKIVVPVSRPIIAVITLYYAAYHWNSWFQAMIYLTNDSLYPLQLYLRNILVSLTQAASSMVDAENQAHRTKIVEVMRYSLIVVASVPMLIAYPFVQKHFVKGIMMGAIKG
ncbi:MAG: carbohydrate ABC transporter permease [Spirochaetaceae bacterium]